MPSKLFKIPYWLLFRRESNTKASCKTKLRALSATPYKCCIWSLWATSVRSNQSTRYITLVVTDDYKQFTAGNPEEEREDGRREERGASNKEGDQNVQDFRAELDNLLVQQKQGFANNTNRVSIVSPSVSAVGESFTNADDLPTDPLMPDLEDTADLLNTSIFSGAYDDEDESAKADLNNLETTMNVSPIPTTRIHRDHPKDQIIGDINSATQTRRMTKISEEHALAKPKKVTQSLTNPRWIEAMKDELLQFSLQKVYVDDIIFGSTKKSLCTEFESLMHKKLQMSYIGELTFFLGLQIMQRDDEIFISQDKYVADILKKFDFSLVKTASTPIETNKAFYKDEEAENQTVVANSTIEAEYVVAANCCGQIHKPRKAKRTTKISQSSGPIHLVADETVYKEWEDRMERAATTAFSLEAEQDDGNINRTQSMETLNEPLPQGTSSGSGLRCQVTILVGAEAQTRFEAASKQSNDLPLSRVYTLGSGEDNMKLKELIELCTMVCLPYYDQHNMVALLEKTNGSEGFHQIVDFLNASHIRFALSENPTIYDSHIKQFWQTATVNTLDNGEQEITATVDGHTPVADEATFIGVDVVHGGASTIVSSMDVGQGSGNITKSLTMPHDSPLPRGLCVYVGYVIFDNQSIERDRIIGIGFVLDFVKFILFTFGDEEMILVI
ncbi:uncharacterized mitochondrial protein-like protein [Tanacetum coccineum]